MCATHGGSAPQVRAAADKRLADLIPLAVDYYEWLLSQREYPSAGLGAANAVWDREKGKPRESVDLNVTGDAPLIAALQQGRKRVAEARKT